MRVPDFCVFVQSGFRARECVTRASVADRGGFRAGLNVACAPETRDNVAAGDIRPDCFSPPRSAAYGAAGVLYR